MPPPPDWEALRLVRAPRRNRQIPNQAVWIRLRRSRRNRWLPLPAPPPRRLEPHEIALPASPTPTLTLTPRSTMELTMSSPPQAALGVVEAPAPRVLSGGELFHRARARLQLIHQQGEEQQKGSTTTPLDDVHNTASPAPEPSASSPISKSINTNNANTLDRSPALPSTMPRRKPVPSPSPTPTTPTPRGLGLTLRLPKSKTYASLRSDPFISSPLTRRATTAAQPPSPPSREPPPPPPKDPPAPPPKTPRSASTSTYTPNRNTPSNLAARTPSSTGLLRTASKHVTATGSRVSLGQRSEPKTPLTPRAPTGNPMLKGFEDNLNGNGTSKPVLKQVATKKGRQSHFVEMLDEGSATSGLQIGDFTGRAMNAGGLAPGDAVDGGPVTPAHGGSVVMLAAASGAEGQEARPWTGTTARTEIESAEGTEKATVMRGLKSDGSVGAERAQRRWKGGLRRVSDAMGLLSLRRAKASPAKESPAKK